MKNYHYFEIKGLNQERFFNNLSKKYQIFEIKRLDKTHSSFKVRFLDGKKVKKIIEANGFEILSEKQGGIIFQACKLLTSYGIIAGILLSSVAYAIQYAFIQKIEVIGSENSPQICQFVEKNLNSKAKSRIDTSQIERMIKGNFDDVSFVSAAIIGQTLLINVKNSLLPSEMNNTFAPLVSQYDGVVTSIELIQGTSHVKVGDIIQKGQILVEGKVVDTSGESRNIAPRAKIYMDVWLEDEQTHYDEKVVTYKTGKSLTNVSATLFGHEFYTNGVVNTFETFESESRTQPLIKNNILPFFVTTTTYYETASETIKSTFEEQKDKFFALTKANCLQNISKNAIIRDEKYLTFEGAGFTTVRCVLTVTLCVAGEDENL